MSYFIVINTADGPSKLCVWIFAGAVMTKFGIGFWNFNICYGDLIKICYWHVHAYGQSNEMIW